MNRIDAHVYCLPPRLRDAGVALPASEEAVAEAIYRHPDGAMALGLSSPDSIRRSMESSGIAGSVLVSMPFTDPALCRETNDFLLELAGRDKAFKVIASVNPASPGWREEAGLCLGEGAIGIKVNPAWQGFDLDGPQMEDFAAWMAGRRAFIMTHIDQAYKESRSSPARLYRIAPRHPSTRFLAAHMGGMLGAYNLRPENAAQLRNIWFDTAVSQTLKMVAFYVAAGLEDRIVFGTDFPFNHCHDQQSVVEGIAALGFTAEVEGMIFSGNLESLVGG